MANYSTTNNGTVLTVPADKLWKGQVYISAGVSVGANGSAVAAQPMVQVVGSTADNWADGDCVAAAALSCSAVLLTALTGTQETNSGASGEVQFRTRGTGITLKLVLPTGTTGVAYAIGEFVI